METGPPQVVEAIVGLLIPSACREHVLGDLCERYTSPRRYVLDAAQTVPLVVWSQVRRTSTTALVLAEFGVLYLSFLGAAARLDIRALSVSSAPHRFAIPALAALAALVLRDAYAGPQVRSAFLVALDAIVGVVLALVSQAVLAAIGSPLALPQVVTSVGGAFSLVMLSAVRVTLSPTMHGAATRGGLMKPSESRHKPMGPQRDLRLWWWTIGVGGVAMWTFMFVHPLTSRFRPMLVGWLVGFIAIGVYQRRKIRWPIPPEERHATAGAVETYRSELERQRDAQSRWPARRGPVVAGVVAFPLVVYALRSLVSTFTGSPVPPFGPVAWISCVTIVFSFCLFFLTRTLTNRAARAFQHEIDVLDSRRETSDKEPK